MVYRGIRHCLVVAVCGLVGSWATAASAQVGKPLETPLLEANTATEAQLREVPHMTAEIVTELIEKRPFLATKDFNEYLASKMLSEAQRTEIYGKLFLHINLNTATEEEIKLIPQMTDRMVHEFEEYRPYDNIEKFRREMAKYVSDDEVKRLEQYVFVPINLNTASEELIKTIPGMTDRMVHEFEEYRPYDNIEKFRREMAKYVSDNEVKRLERYVTLGAQPNASPSPSPSPSPTPDPMP